PSKILPRLREMLEQVAAKMGCKILEFSGESDHVHLLVDFHPRNSIAAVVSSLKASPSRMVKKEFPEDYEKHYSGDKAFGSGLYYVASVGGTPLETAKAYIAYIANQSKPNG
ncbi:MAG: IS200/IS605 family transposase, partial [Thermostichus sp. DG02_2_bins_29]